MTDLYNRIVSQHSGFERIMAYIPGYRGYKVASDRRAADRMMREHVVGALKEQMNRLIAIEKKQVSSGNLAFANQTRSAKLNFQTFIDRVNTAAPGYSGFYDAQKVGPNELEHIYAFDAALISYADKFREAIDSLDKALQTKEGLDATITGLETLAQEANTAYGLRDQVLTGLV